MSNLEKIYAITCGEYSDYRVLAVTTDKKAADLWKEALASSEDGWLSAARVEEMLCIPKGVKPYKVTTYYKTINLWDNGRSSEEREYETTDWAINTTYGEPPIRPYVRYVRAPVHGNRGGRLEARGANKEAVRKAVADRVRKWVAGQFGGPSVSELVEE